VGSAPESLIVAPAPGRLAAAPVEIWGWAWAAAGVDVSVDGGESWSPAEIEPRREWSWQRCTAPCSRKSGRGTRSIPSPSPSSDAARSIRGRRFCAPRAAVPPWPPPSVLSVATAATRATGWVDTPALDTGEIRNPRSHRAVRKIPNGSRSRLRRPLSAQSRHTRRGREWLADDCSG